MAQHDQNTRETSMNETPLPTFSFHQNIQIGSALVIGGCGFLGHHVVKTLLAEPTCTSVAVMSRSPFKRRFSNVTYHLGDITKSEHVDNLICQLKPNVIVNTASPHAYIDHEHAHEYFSVK
jgi:sterol-4alpha-carboxylate 3-dehydrogenase (decarboxylating)